MRSKRYSPEGKIRAFKRLATRRTQKAIHQQNLIANLSNPKNYEWTKEEVRQVVEALNQGIAKLEATFVMNNRAKPFKLD